ncbi:TetR/AcrR family transcriptional regulator [Actinocatenispora rupis]|uniref:TetR family transcriptional regulator n=1 Tax=Actinocatenispora rupis TaxID=519421 RepID=A0A8J3J5E7_9ACTN|nr:TetR/AcrR family transcriptional regulator [Actinocatenispora rupis]GID16181.1 TetR family transcriptional regulator [Actinocatenispora rupis]
MRQNPARRTALLDAAIDVLARDGSRGLTLRAIDAAASVPTGTATNYFRDRDDLLGQVMRRTRERLAPDPAVVERTMRAPRDAKLVAELMRQLVDRMRADRASNLAMLELRLEATRRAALGDELGGFLTAEHTELIDFHLGAGLPGDRIGVALLYFAMSGLLLDDLTLPAIPDQYRTDELVATLVARVLSAPR